MNTFIVEDVIFDRWRNERSYVLQQRVCTINYECPREITQFGFHPLCMLLSWCLRRPHHPLADQCSLATRAEFCCE